MIQQGQVFKLKTKGPHGQPLWAYQYRLEGRDSERPQVGGFATRAEAEKALRKVIDRLGPGGGRATITLGEFVNEYLEMHQAAPVTITKLRWLLGKATEVLGEKRLADLSPRDVYAWRMTVPEGHRFEATQALRQVLNRAVAWRLLDYNPAKLGVPNPPRRAREKRPFEMWRQIEAVAEQLGPVYGPTVIFAAATGLRPSELFGLEQRDVDRGAGVVYIRRAYNAVCESFHATLEKELLRRRSFRTKHEARTAIFDWIESWYNRERRHSRLGYRSPAQYERDHEKSDDCASGTDQEIFIARRARAA